MSAFIRCGGLDPTQCDTNNRDTKFGHAKMQKTQVTPSIFRDQCSCPALVACSLRVVMVMTMTSRGRCDDESRLVGVNRGQKENRDNFWSTHGRRVLSRVLLMSRFIDVEQFLRSLS